MSSTSGRGSFEGKAAFVTGGGIGRASALAFAREGTDVAVADVAEEANRVVGAAVVVDGGQTT